MALQCRFVVDLYADTDTINEADKAKLKFWFEKKPHPQKGTVNVPIPYFPAGTVYDRTPLYFIEHGLAEPANEEARIACGLTEDELKARQLTHRRVAAGIQPDDFVLFDAGVIVGYEPETGEYRPGPNWASYQASLKEAAANGQTSVDI